MDTINHAQGTASPTTNPTPSSIKTRFLIISDTHSSLPIPSPSTAATPFREPLPKSDVLLHCGDLTMIGHLHEYERALKLLSEASAELKLVIAGNHDITLDEKYYSRMGQRMHNRKWDPQLPAQARELWTGEKARAAGVTYLEEGVHSFTLSNGARLRVYASPYQPEFCDWAFPYFRNEDRFNPPHLATPGSTSIAERPIPDFPAIDVVMAHGPPFGHLDRTSTGLDVGCEHLLRALKRCRPRLHCFGHIHEGWGAKMVKWKDGDEHDETESVAVDDERTLRESSAAVDATTLEFGKESLLVNASIMTVRYKAEQAPWLVDLNLEKA
ncbi:Metallo-dependent phosphatase [Amniculicola lignicola CBS 123094]|uniref:Metallo-dependent phosphatase n=1 Tax=Amniculicola lignicola CBS 123094 TaxID=1392246 RepID=A0A6A5WBC6_9PLEO|nr:Metallo-dependent phosphatase [Amniculicola lignicola CBS 123094]